LSSPLAPSFSAWLDGFFDAYYRRRPVNATFIGMHAYDDRLPDLSEAGQAQLASDAARLLAELTALGEEPLSAPERLDRQLAAGFLEIQAWEATSPHYGWGNPSLYTGEAVFGVLSLLLRPFAPLGVRLELASARLAAIPRLLDDGRATLHAAPRAWSLRARRECEGARLLLDQGLPRLLHDAGLSHATLMQNAEYAREAFARFDAFIEAELLPDATEAYACGAETFDLLLRRAHFLERDAESLEHFALEVMAEEATMVAAGPRARAESQATHAGHSSSALDAVPPYPAATVATTAGGDSAAGEGGSQRRYLDRFSELWQVAREAAERENLLTFPDWPVHYVEQPAWVREAAPYFYFLPYRAPAPFDQTPVVDYFVPPAADDSTIKLNHVIHHGSLGHHVQNWHAARAASRIGQVAAVDCAARIAMLCGGTLAEGWACYSTDLADAAGLLTPAESFAQHTARLRMGARAVVDIRLHHGRQSLDDAADFYRERVGMSAAAAHAEAVKNSLFPGAACMYLAGWDGIWRLRRELEGRAGFSLQAFHDQFLSMGSVPVSLVGRAMLEASPALATR
jgi:Bacterial protein of unknown function (DUF885)